MQYSFHTKPFGPVVLPSGKFICGVMPWVKYTKTNLKKMTTLYNKQLKVKKKSKPKKCFEEIEVVSNTDKSKKYIVTLKDGKYSCDCVGYGFRRKCSHIEKVKKIKEKGQ